MATRSPRACLICSAPTCVTHLGIEACRACAAFFKRTEIAGRKYTCRRGDKACKIDREQEKYMCRSCRYDRCAQFGMSYDLPRKRKIRRSAAATGDVPSASTRSPERESLIDRVEKEYEAWYDRRLAQEKQLVGRLNLQPLHNSREELFLITFDSFYEIYRITLNESAAFLRSVFEDFESLQKAHKDILLKNFVGKFHGIETMYFTSKYLKNTNLTMSSLTTCCNLRNIHQWVTEKGEIVDEEAFRASIEGFTNEFVSLFDSMQKVDDISKPELYALVVLIYCDIDSYLDLPDEIIKNAAKTRERIFVELQEYYKSERNLRNFSERIGNLMTMVHGAGEVSILMREEMRMYATVFDIYSDDRMLCEFFSKCAC